MKCIDFEENYLLFLYEELNKDESKNYKEHIESCNSCKEIFEEAKDTKFLLDHMEKIEVPDDIVNKVKENALKYKLSPVKEKSLSGYVINILNVLFYPKMRLAFACILFIIIAGATYLIKVNYSVVQNNNETITSMTLYDEAKIDKNIKNIEHNANNLSDSRYSFGLDKKDSSWNVSYIDQKITDMETEVKKMKKEYKGF